MRDVRLTRSAPSEQLDGIARIAANLFGMPAALLTVVDGDVVWVRASYGDVNIESIPAEEALCAKVVTRAETVVESFERTWTDFCFYAGAPVFLDGACVGTLCVIDRHAHTFTADMREVLASLAGIASTVLAGETHPTLSPFDWDVLQHSIAFSDSGITVYEHTPGDDLPRIAYANKEMLRRSQRSLSDLQNGADAFFEQRGARELILSLLERARAQDERSMDFQVHYTDGHIRWLESRCRRLQDGPHGALRFIAFTRDVTERKRDESFRHLLSAAVEQTPQAVFMVRMDDTPTPSEVIYSNAAFTKLTGFERGSDYVKIFGPDTDMSVVLDSVTHIRNGQPTSGEVVLYRASGEKFLGRYRAHAIDAPERFAVIMIADVTDERRSERTITMLSQAVEDAGDFLMIVDDTPLESNGPKIIFANRAIVEMSGYSEEELAGQVFAMLFSPENPPELIASIKEHVGSGKPNYREVIIRRRDGSDFWVEYVARPFVDPETKRNFRFVVGRDISTRKNSFNQTALLMAAMDGASDAIILYQPAADGTLEATYENEMARSSAQYRLARLWQSANERAFDIRTTLALGGEVQHTFAELDNEGRPHLVQMKAGAVLNGLHLQGVVSVERELANAGVSDGDERHTLLLHVAGMLSALVRTDSTEERLSVLRAMLLAAFDAEVIADVIPVPIDDVQVAAAWSAAKFALGEASYTVHWKRALDPTELTALRLCIEATIDEERKRGG